MNRRVLALLLIAGMVGGSLLNNVADADLERPERGEVAVDSGDARLYGAWEIEAIEIQGRRIPAPKGKGGSIVFSTDRKVVMKDQQKADKPGTYKIDISKTPKHLDLIEGKDGGKKGEVMEAIYAVEGDNLRMGFSAKGPKGRRPRAFDDKETVILHLKRQKS